MVVGMPFYAAHHTGDSQLERSFSFLIQVFNTNIIMSALDFITPSLNLEINCITFLYIKDSFLTITRPYYLVY